MKKVYLFVIMFSIVLLTNGQKLPFQGKLIESGVPVNGNRTIALSISNIGWSETHADVPVTDGLYFIVLGSTNPIPANIFSGANERQIEISVNGTPLSPVTLYKPLAGELKEINIKGPGNGLLRAGFGTGSSLNENRPSLAMKGNLEGNRLSFNVLGNNDGTFEAGNISLNSSSGNITSMGTGSIYFSTLNGDASLMTSNQLFLRQGNNYNLQLFNQNWGNKGHSGTILLTGPNSLNFEIGNRHWENADLPRINMRGSADNAVIELSATNDENESGFMSLHSRNGHGALLNVWNFGLNANGKRTASVETQGVGSAKQKGVVILEDSDGNKSSFTPHHLTVNGPDWKEYVMIKGTNEGDNSHGGHISLTGPNDKKAFISPEGISLNDASGGRGVSIRSTEYGSSATQGLIELFGANSPDPYKRTGVLATGDWGNGDFGMLHLIGSHAQVSLSDKLNNQKIALGLVNNNGETGRLSLKGTNPHVALHGEGHGQPTVILNVMPGDGGSSGMIELKGQNTQNFYIGSAYWENSNKPWMNMSGKDDRLKMTITTADDANGEKGVLTLSNSNGVETAYSNNGTYGTLPFNMWSGAMVNGILTVNGNIQGSGTNSYNSDERLKKEIQPLSESTLNKIESLGGYSYFWKKEEYPNKNFSSDQQIGLLAQELEAQFPALVKTGDDGFKSVNYNGFTAVLLEAVKELNLKVENLEKENKLLKGELVAATASQKEMNELKSQIEALAKLVQLKIDSAGDSQSAENVTATGLK